MNGRLTVLHTIYHQQSDEGPTVCNGQYVRNLETDEQPSGPRSFKVGFEWIPIPKGWIEECSIVCLENLEGRNLQVRPTVEEQAEIDSRIIEIAFLSTTSPQHPPDPSLLLSPREMLPLTPVSVSMVRVRCQNGTAKCSVTMFPR